jgi:hypothetical protein
MALNPRTWFRPKEEARDNYPYAFSQWIDDSYLSFNGTTYPIFPSMSMSTREETIPHGWEGLINYAYRSNGVVFACELARIMLFSQARFQFQQMRNGQPGKLFGTAELSLLETPWPGGTTADLLAGMEQDSGMAGNAFVWRKDARTLERLRPDWVTIVAGSMNDPDVTAWDPGAEVLAYVYHPGGRGSRSDPVVIPADQVAHFAPIPDPLARWRGLSWLSPVMVEVMGDTAATRHKLSFFENGATANFALVSDITDVDKFDQWSKRMENMLNKTHVGASKAYKTLLLGAGVDPKTLGANMQQMEFAVTQGAGENRICMASGVPAIIAGGREGLQAATYSNFNQARRSFGDRTHWLWMNACGSLAKIINVPGGSRLWYDAEHIPFLREDSKDQAAVQLVDAQAIRLLVDAGFTADSVVAAIAARDVTQLVHTGLVSVQLLPPGETGAPPPPAPVSGMPAGRALAELIKTIDLAPETQAALDALTAEPNGNEPVTRPRQ